MDSANRKLTQKQFNELVQENIDELGMDDDDAVEAAVEQMVAQEVSLANIIPDIWVVKREDPISRFCDKYNQIPLATTIGRGFKMNECLEMMKRATEIAKKRLNYRLYAVDCTMDDVILSLAKMRNADETVITACLRCLNGVYTSFPDQLKGRTVDCLLETYDESNEAIKCLVLNVINEVCTAHENNKQLVFSRTDLIKILQGIINSDSNELLPLALRIICNLCKDDDIRVEESDACKRAVVLAAGSLRTLYDMVERSHPLEVKVLVLEALASLTVTDQLVLEVFHHPKQFSILEDVLTGTFEDADITISTLKFLLALGKNSEAKCAMKPLVPLIIKVITHLQGNPQVMQIAFMLISVLASGNKDNAITFIAVNAVEIVLQGMKVHEKFLEVQQNGCLALQNMASSSEDLKPFEMLRVAELITKMIAYSGTKTLTDVCKGTLVALGATVVLENSLEGKHLQTS